VNGGTRPPVALAIVADDLTGAADAATPFARADAGFSGPKTLHVYGPCSGPSTPANTAAISA